MRKLTFISIFLVIILLTISPTISIEDIIGQWKYTIDFNGEQFSTFVDADGYLQVAVDFGNGKGSLPQETSLTNTTRGILSPTILATLTEAKTARISHSGDGYLFCGAAPCQH